MLDPLPIGEEEPLTLRCERCGMFFTNSEPELDNYLNIDEEGVCLICSKNYEQGIGDGDEPCD